MMIRTERITKIYKKRTVPAVKDLTFEMQEGEILAVIGVNGAGKTTLTKMLLGLIYPTSGNAWLFDHPITEGKWKGNVGYLPEIFQAEKHSRATDVLQYLGTLNGVHGIQLKSRIDEILAIVGLQNDARKKLGQYSKGMMRRLGVAQALLHEPRLLFLDEPTEGLDPVGRKTVRDTLLELKSRGVSILLNSHLLSEVETIADRIMIIHKGEIIKQGNLPDILPSNQGYTVDVSTEPTTTSRWVFEKNNGSWRCSIGSSNDLQALLSELSIQNIPVLSITPVRGTLEDAFVTYIQER
jgi:ABC-2 type transport system ATP-binding protein